MDEGMAGRATHDADVVYVGFLLGHGGDALQMLALATGMRESGARVRIVVPEVPSSVTFKERCDTIGVPCARTPLISASMAGAGQSLPSMLRLLRAIRAPIVHFHTGNSVLPRSVMLALELLRYRRSIATLQSPYETITPGSARARFWAFTARRRLAAVVSPSTHGTVFQLRCGVPADIALTIRNSIDVNAFASGDAHGPRATLGVDADVPVVLFSSRVDAQKRPVEAVRIFAGAAAEFPTALLVFVGGGDEEQKVVAESKRLGISDRLRMMGYQTNIPSWLAAATVWLLPTERENFSVAVLEALAAGCPVLSTSCRGNDEVLVDGENALVFAVGDVDAATVKLRSLLCDRALRGKLAQGAQATAQQYSVPRMVEAYRSIYGRVRNAPTALRG
jgi:glycosyltransferase involved in cell wall biosynthesis